ncbi:MAG: hypothetical protein KBA61_09760 [Spirochaetes bacterium]|nr:hypothetical protein [Spirochaetota bacterium]
MTASEFFRGMLRDRTLPMLAMANFVNILIATQLGYGFATQVWVYLCQSVIIGIFNFRRILLMRPSEETIARWDRESAQAYRDMKTEGGPQDWLLPKTADDYVRWQHWTPGTPKVFAGIFLAHFGLFHLIYIFSLSSRHFSMIPGTSLAEADPLGVAAGALIFLVFHAWSFRTQRREMERPFTSDYAMPKAMFLPYARVLPIHLSAVFFAGNAFMAFLIIKALVDIAAHVVELAWRRSLSYED